MNFFLKKIFKRNIIKNMSYVAGASFVAQGINIVILPLLSRIYSPSDFGILSVYTSVVGILTMFTGLRYYLAIPLPKQEKYARALLYVTSVAHCVFVFMLFVFAYFVGDYILDKIHLSSLQPYLYLIPFGVFVTGAYTIATQWAVREGFFSTIGWTRILQAICGNGAKLALGIIGCKPMGLLLGAVVAQGCGSSGIFRASIKKKSLKFTLSRTDIKRSVIKYRNFPIYDMWTAVINVVGQNMPQLFLSFYYSLNTVGFYTMAVSLLSLPISIVGAAVGQVFVQRGAQAKYDGTLASFSEKSYRIMLTLSMYPIIALSLLAPIIFSFFLGTQWEKSGLYAIVLSPKVAYSMTYSPLCMLYAIGGRIKQSFYHEILLTLVMLCGLYLGSSWNNPTFSVLVYSLFSLVIMIWRIAYILSDIGIERYKVLRITFSVFMEAACLLFLPSIMLLFNYKSLCTVLFWIVSGIIFVCYNYYKFCKRHIL